MFAKVLIGFDGSEGAWRALRAGVTFAWKHGAQATAVAVVPPPHPGARIQETAETERAMGRALDAARDHARSYGLDLAAELRHGDPASTIVNLVRDGGFDLVVLGRTGHASILEHLLGSIADKVSRHAPCSVMIVP